MKYLKLYLLMFLLALRISGELAEESHLTVHVVTHSHLDPGWVYDVEKCYDTSSHIFSSVF